MVRVVRVSEQITDYYNKILETKNTGTTASPLPAIGRSTTPSTPSGGAQPRATCYYQETIRV